MNCFFCKKDIVQSEISTILPLKHGTKTVYGCTTHPGVKEQSAIDFPKTKETEQ